jgi:hypothetical protein
MKAGNARNRPVYEVSQKSDINAKNALDGFPIKLHKPA